MSIFYTFGSSTGNISGGAVNSFGACNSSAVEISGGSMDGLYAFGSSTVDISGGAMNYLHARDSTTLTFYGKNFLGIDGLILDAERVLGTGILTGEWFDGTPWSTRILMNLPTATILAVPEPTALLLSSLVSGQAVSPGCAD